MFNVGKTKVYEILKKKTEILKRWINCANGKIKRELKKTANDDVNEIVWEWFVSVRAKNPLEWRSDKKVWMTSQIMEGWLTAFNGRMKMQMQFFSVQCNICMVAMIIV
jgi:hypothetical protein